jgi:hypothetical protein
MKFIVLKIALINSIIFLITSAYAQIDNKDLLSVNLSIVCKGKASVCRQVDTSTYYIVVVNIVNLQDTTIKFWVMDDCWSADNFFIKHDSITFESCFSGCEHTMPLAVVVPPKKSAQFYATIYSAKKQATPSLIKVGFKYFPTAKEQWDYGTPGHRKAKVFWSNEVELKDNLYSFEIK